MIYRFKHEHFNDGWNDWDDDKFGKPWDEEDAAKKIAEYLYNDEPNDLNTMEEVVWIKSIRGVKKFIVGGYYSETFTASEQK